MDDDARGGRMRRNKQLRNDLKRIRGYLRLEGKVWMVTVIENAISVIDNQGVHIGTLESKIHVLPPPKPTLTE